MNFFNKFDKLKNDYRDNKLSIPALLLCLFFVLALAVGSSYAYLTFTNVAENSNIIVAGTLVLDFLDETDAIYMGGAVPQTDDDALNYNQEHSFSFKNNGTLNVNYKIKLKNSCAVGLPVNINGELVSPEVCIPLDYIKVGVKKGDGDYKVVSVNEDGELILDSGSLLKNEQADTYTFKLWLDQSTPNNYQGMDEQGNDRVVAFIGNIELYGEQSANQSKGNSLLTSILGINNSNVVTSGNGLYQSTLTNSGNPTYYYHGNVNNNYIEFGGKSGGNCTADGHVLVDVMSGIYATKSICLASEGVCDARNLGMTYLIGVDEATCLGSGLTYIATKTQWNDEVCHYKGETIFKYTGNGSDLVAGNLSENECLTLTEMCDARADGFGYVAGVNEQFCNAVAPNGEYITLEESPSFGKLENPLLWRVVRINEDNTIRLISDTSVGGPFNSTYKDYKYMYYSESNVEGGIKKALNDWYDANLTDYDSKIATSTFCEQAKVKYWGTATSGNTEMMVYTDYTPDFKCATDGNGYGLITDQKVGLITVDELLYAGGSFYETTQFYLSNTPTWTMSPAGFYNSDATAWGAFSDGVDYDYVYDYIAGLPVISLNADTMVTGHGTIDSPWKVITDN